MCVSLCACGGGTGYKVVKTLADQEYSIGFRNGDSTYHYISGALRELSFDGTVDKLAKKWFGSSSAVSFPSSRDALSEYGYISPRTFIIGVDMGSFPMCCEQGGGYSGFDVELAQAVCEKLGWQLKVQPILSENAYVELNSGNIDCAWGGVVLDSSSRDYTILFTYMSNKLVIAGQKRIGSSLRGKTLYVSPSQSYIDILGQQNNVLDKLGQVTKVRGGTVDFFDYLDNGACDLIVTTSSAVSYYNNN